MRKVDRRHAILIAVAAVLVVVNVVRWVAPGRDARNPTTRTSTLIEADDLRVKVAAAPETNAGPPRRDLFRPKLPPPLPKIVPVTVPTGPPPKTPEQIEQEAALAELGRIRCVGTAQRDRKWQAFLTQGDQVYLVSIGDRIGSRFVVETIAGDGVYLKDPKTNVAGRIQMTGS